MKDANCHGQMLRFKASLTMTRKSSHLDARGRGEGKAFGSRGAVGFSNSQSGRVPFKSCTLPKSDMAIENFTMNEDGDFPIKNGDFPLSC